MPCLPVIAGLLFPRLTLVLLWLFADWFDAAYSSLLWPLIGLLFAPLTAIWYAIVVTYYGGEWSLVPIIGMVVAIGLDFGFIGGGTRERSRRG